MRRLFGTDGIRGVANQDLTPDLALALGRAAGQVLVPEGGEIVIGRDTRISGPMLEGALVAGLCSAGVRVRLAGVVPSPAVAWLTIDEHARAGAVISASHNPVADNGIKFFSELGTKIAEVDELGIEKAMAEESPAPVPAIGTSVGSAEILADGADRYVAYLVASLDASLEGLKVVLDCAHGAAWDVGPRAFREAGAEIVTIHDTPDGSRINVDSGSTSMGLLSKTVLSEGADFGLAFDGDADRVLAVDEKGRPIDGDRIIGMTALRMLEKDELHNNMVVVTVMSNLGFRRALEQRGIEVVVAPVGDKYVVEAMTETGAVLGGEQSGHVIFGRLATTGDGVLTGLHVALARAENGGPLSQMVDFYETFPQVLINVETSGKDRLDDSEELWDEIKGAEAKLGEDGRVLVRASGTEPLVRVMVEAAERAVAERVANDLAGSVRRHLGP